MNFHLFGEIMITELKLTQKEANDLLRALDFFVSVNADIHEDVKSDMLSIYDKIFDAGIDAGFGQQIDLKKKGGKNG